MKKILIAMDNEELFNKINEKKMFNIIAEDIQYKEGILELLNKNNNVDYIILNNLLPGIIEIKELIDKINLISNKIKIIIFLDNQNNEIQNYFNNKKIYKIFYDNEIEINDLINFIDNDTIENYEKDYIKIEGLNIEKNNQDILNKKELNNKRVNERVNEKVNKKIKEKINKIKNINFNKLIEKNNKIQNKNPKIISILGAPGVGKSIITINLSKIKVYFNKKILIIDFDYINNSISTILGLKKIHENTNIIKINKKIDLLNINKNNYNKIIKNILSEKYINNYNYIFIDTFSFNNLDLIKEIINFSNFSIFISDTNLLEINKSIKLLDLFINKLKINKNKFQILFNKYNSESIDIKILKNIFSEIKIIGYLKYNNKYNSLINKNNRINYINKDIRNEFFRINKLI